MFGHRERTRPISSTLRRVSVFGPLVLLAVILSLIALRKPPLAKIELADGNLLIIESVFTGDGSVGRRPILGPKMLKRLPEGMRRYVMPTIPHQRFSGNGDALMVTAYVIDPNAEHGRRFRGGGAGGVLESMVVVDNHGCVFRPSIQGVMMHENRLEGGFVRHTRGFESFPRNEETLNRMGTSEHV